MPTTQEIRREAFDQAAAMVERFIIEQIRQCKPHPTVSVAAMTAKHIAAALRAST